MIAGNGVFGQDGVFGQVLKGALRGSLLSPVSAQISRQEAPEARSRAILTASTTVRGRPSRFSRRMVALSPSAIRALVAHQSRCIDPGPDRLVFGAQDGSPPKANQLRDLLKQACKRAGVREVDFHTLRDTHSTLLHATGAPLKAAQAQLGHSSAAMSLDVYTHALPMLNKKR